jgi:hypothetical protein
MLTDVVLVPGNLEVIVVENPQQYDRESMKSLVRTTTS